MLIKKPFFSPQKDFNTINLCNMLTANKMQITDAGAVASFICPTEITINNLTVTIDSSLNICYVLPTATGRELAYFHLLYNQQIGTAINSLMPEQKIKSENSIFTKEEKITGTATISHSCCAGIGWHTIFLSKMDSIPGIEFNHIDIPEDKKDEISDKLHTAIQTSFNILRNYATITSINTASNAQ